MSSAKRPSLWLRLVAASLCLQCSQPLATSRRDLLRTAAGASLAPATVRAETRSPRPVSWRIVDGDPPVMQPYVSRAVESCLKQIASFDVVLLGAKRGDAGDYALAAEAYASYKRESDMTVADALENVTNIIENADAQATPGRRKSDLL